MHFVDYIPVSFADINKTAVTLVTAIENTLIVNSLIVCNKTKTPIRLNLKKVRTGSSPTEIFYINEFEIKAYDTVDIVKEKGLNIFLQYSQTPTISDSLACYSNGLSQKFDCELNYAQLKELPSSYCMV